MCLIPPLVILAVWIAAFLQTRSYAWATVATGVAGAIMVIAGYGIWRQFFSKEGPPTKNKRSDL